MTIISTLMFVAGCAVGAAAGHWLGRWPYSARSAPARPERSGPQTGRSGLSLTHPAVPRPALYDWQKDGAA